MIMGSEGRVLARAGVGVAAPGRAGGPRVLGPALRSGGAAATAVAAASEVAAVAATAAEAAASAAARGLGDLRRGVAQRRADLVDLELDDRALLALLGVVRAAAEAAADDHPGATGQRLGDVLRRLPPDRAAHEEGLAVLPLVRLPIEVAGGAGDGEVRDGRAGRREPQLGVVGEVADDGDDGLAGHAEPAFVSGRSVRAQWASGRMSLVRRTASLRLSCRSSSFASAGSACMSTTA